MKLKQTTGARESNSKSVANESRKGKSLPASTIAPVAQAVFVYLDSEEGNKLDLKDIGNGKYQDEESKLIYVKIDETLNGKIIVKKDGLKNEHEKRKIIELEINEGEKNKKIKKDENEEINDEKKYTISDEMIKEWKILTKGEALHYQKDNENEACFNWALTGLKNDGVEPRLIMDYLNGFGKLSELKSKVSTDNRKALSKLVKEMKKAGIQLTQTIEKTINSSHHKKIIEMIKKAGRIIVKEHQFEIVEEDETNMVIVMQSNLSDGVSWEHWWIEVDGIVLETFPKKKFIQVTPDRQHDGDENYITTRFPVKSLKKEHVDFFSKK